MDPKFEQRTQSYDFDCQHCGTTWKTDYEIREASDPEGEEYELFLLDGMPVTPPRAGIGCPACGTKVTGHLEHYEARAPRRPAHPTHQIDGMPLVVLKRQAMPGGGERIALSVATTRLVFQHGPGELPAEVRARVQAPVPVHVAGTGGEYSAAHWTDGQAHLVWERDGRWYELAGHAQNDLLVATANDLMADLDGLGIVAR
jgi:hypothetical protein